MALTAMASRRVYPAASATKQQLLAAMQGHVLGKAELIGTYERKK
jgi:phosphatidylethanolamine-binding protein (PEBP) family uncharacterized protein